VPCLSPSEQLIAAIEAALAALLPGPAIVGYSGGMDSSLLLHCAARSERVRGRGLRALHVHHGLHPDADAWAALARTRAQALGIACDVVRVRVDPRGQGIEAAAREARLAAFAEALSGGGAMLLAHHQDDQAETLLLRLLRGASVDGLGAMRAVRAHGAGLILRPWLDQPRAQLHQAAQELGIAWVEDPANADPKHDRSWLRQQAWPLLAARFPALGERLARLAGHAASVSDEIEALAAAQLERLGGGDPASLSADGLLDLSEALFGAVLRRQARRLGVHPPGFHELRRIRAEVLLAKPDANPVLRQDGFEYRRYRDRLYLLDQRSAAPIGELTIEWPAGQPAVQLPGGLGTLALVDAAGDAVPAAVDLRIGWRRGGERIRPVGSAHTRELRLLFQEQGVPPWRRERIPLLWHGGELLAAVGVASSARLAELLPGAELRLH